MNALYRALKALEKKNDPDLLVAYRAFIRRLEGILTPLELEIYAVYTTRERAGRSAASETPAEATVTTKIRADTQATALNKALIALLAARKHRSRE